MRGAFSWIIGDTSPRLNPMINWGMISNAQTYLYRENAAYTGVSGVLSAIWLWLQMLSRGVWEGGFALNTPRPDAPIYTVNRAQRKLRGHHAGRPIAPARNLSAMRPLYGRGISPTQFLERQARLSVEGRINTYRLPYWSSRMSREAFMAIFSKGDFRAPQGLCAVRLGPD